MAQLFGPLNSGDAAGGAGVATANADSSVILSGFVLAIYVRYNDSPPAGTTDVTIATKGTNAPANTILTITDAATDGWFYPRHLAQDETGANLDTAADELRIAVPIHDIVNVKIDQANNGDSIDVWFLMGYSAGAG